MIIQFQIGRGYSTQEVIQMFGISKTAWAKRKTKLLESLSQCYTFEINKQGNKVFYCFTSKHKDFSFKAKVKAKEREQKYNVDVLKVVMQDRLQTSSSIQRQINLYGSKEKYKSLEFQHKQSSQYEYIRTAHSYCFGKIGQSGGQFGYIPKKVWCFPQGIGYEPMPQEQVQKLEKIIDQTLDNVKDTKERVKELCQNYEVGEITKEQMDRALGQLTRGKYSNAIDRYMEQNNIPKSKRPIKVPYHQFYLGKEYVEFIKQVG